MSFNISFDKWPPLRWSWYMSIYLCCLSTWVCMSIKSISYTEPLNLHLYRTIILQSLFHAYIKNRKLLYHWQYTIQPCNTWPKTHLAINILKNKIYRTLQTYNNIKIARVEASGPLEFLPSNQEPTFFIIIWQKKMQTNNGQPIC